jgi:hypothetical protein
LEAVSYKENISVPSEVFEIPGNFRIIDGDKLEAIKENASYPFCTVIIEYSSLRNVGEIKEVDKQIL